MSRPPRLRGFEYSGRHTYFLTFCTDSRAEILRDHRVATMVLECIRRTSDRYGFAVYAYCLMPDHVHLLVHGTSPAADLRRFVKTTKQSSGQIYAARAKRRLWQESYYDHVVRPEEDLSAIARYIIDNPVRAGLVQSSLDYPFVGSDMWPVEALVGGGSVLPGPGMPGPRMPGPRMPGPRT
jgi:putative transposase